MLCDTTVEVREPSVIDLLAGSEGPHCVVLDEAALSGTAGVVEFGNAAVDLVVELATSIAFLCDHPGPRIPRDEWILRGLAVRTVKLLDRVVDESVRGHGEMQVALERLLLDTIVTLGYLLVGPDDRFQAYVVDGLVTPRRRRAEILRRVSSRGGVARLIETRQLRAIESELSLAGVTGDETEPRLPNMEQQIKVVFGDGTLVYDFGYRMGSAAVHGGFKDLLDRHVTTDGQFTPILAWSDADPQVLMSALIFAAYVFARYAQHVGAEEIADGLVSLQARSKRLFDLYGPVFESRRAQT